MACLQETKLADSALLDLLADELADRGYEVAVHGEAGWNGVAIFSRVGLEDVVPGLAGAPGFPHPEARALAATCGGVRVHSVYVPNGREPGSEHYEYKLAWLAALRDAVAAGPEAAVVCGDVNIAQSQLPRFIAKHALSPGGIEGNVRLRAVPDDAWRELEGRSVAPAAAVALDLADEPDSRSREAGKKLIRQIDGQHRARAKER